MPYRRQLLDAADTAQQTPLHIAAAEGHDIIARVMLTTIVTDQRTFMAHVEAEVWRLHLLRAADAAGRTPLHCDARMGRARTVMLLLELAPVAGHRELLTLLDAHGWTPLQLAMQNECRDVS